MNRQLKNENDHSIAVFDYKSRKSASASMISTLGNYQGWNEIEVTVDSEPCDTVMPLSLCTDITLLESVRPAEERPRVRGRKRGEYPERGRETMLYDDPWSSYT